MYLHIWVQMLYEEACSLSFICAAVMKCPDKQRKVLFESVVQAVGLETACPSTPAQYLTLTFSLKTV